MKPRFLLTYFTFAARLLRGLVVVALMTDTIVASGQEVINFNAAHAYWSGTNYYESDMGFAVFPTGSNSRMLISPAVTSPLGNPYNNTPYMIFVPQSADDYVAFSLTNGNTFGLDSVFLADP